MIVTANESVTASANGSVNESESESEIVTSAPNEDELPTLSLLLRRRKHNRRSVRPRSAGLARRHVSIAVEVAAKKRWTCGLSTSSRQPRRRIRKIVLRRSVGRALHRVSNADVVAARTR